MTSEGMCSFCKKVFPGRGIERHLLACHARTESQAVGDGKIFLIKAAAGPFWVYFEVDAPSTLKKVDSFLRDLWLECCGHLSSFSIGGVTYAYNPQPEYGDKSMNVKLNGILRPGMNFGHEYDFGTTTALAMKCVSERAGKAKDGITVIARNNMPEFNCGACKKPAKEICSQCVFERDAFLCATCAKKHECGEEMLLPVVNSPRVGMCGYTG